ncbi:FitA-like ribbon-helix-helix domain-containing protein [Floridanema aerugineum]|uniref:Antitoxin FitA-like ribbon-helix-helix domain-containing protein n=1 Tax=Floridaenema aerugineum BLCC-F46 TaxID=3153654 RepID=A0ABV4X366_9CYAN
MATLTIENLPDDLMAQLQQLASQNNQTINEQIINLLKEAIQKPQLPLKFLISPETDPTWEERRKAVPQILADLDKRRRLNPADFGLPDSTELIREDRER